MISVLHINIFNVTTQTHKTEPGFKHRLQGTLENIDSFLEGLVGAWKNEVGITFEIGVSDEGDDKFLGIVGCWFNWAEWEE